MTKLEIISLVFLIISTVISSIIIGKTLIEQHKLHKALKRNREKLVERYFDK